MLKQLVSMIQDGEGNTSAMRVMSLIVIIGVIVPPFIAAIKTGGTIQWTSSDMEMIGIALGGKLLQNSQENKSTTPTATPSSPTSTIPKVQ